MIAFFCVGFAIVSCSCDRRFAVDVHRGARWHCVELTKWVVLAASVFLFLGGASLGVVAARNVVGDGEPTLVVVFGGTLGGSLWGR